MASISHKKQSDILNFLHSNRVNSIGTYTLDKTIGEGSFGKVKLAYHNLTGQKVAIKIVDKIHAPSLIREIETWRQLHHPNIAQLYEVLTSESKIYMVTEYCNGGELLDYITQNGKMDDSDPETIRIFLEIAEAVHKCHEKNLTHRDLKLENILLTDDLKVKLIDFGFTRLYDDKVLLDTYCGSSAYAAPEIVAAQRYSGPEADIWSLGVVLYTIVCGYLPFDAETEHDTHKQIKDIKYEIPTFLRPETCDLIAKFFKKVPSERITIQEIFQHPWVTNIESVTAGKVSSAHSEPMLSNSTAELSLAAKLESAGFNVPVILNSVYSNACDQSSALWHLLLAKQSDDSIAPGKIEIATSGVGHYFEDAQKTPVSANPLLHIVSHTSFSDELQHSDPVLSPSRMTTKKTRKEVQRPATAGVPKITTFKKSGCFDDSDSSPCSSEAFTVTFKQRPQSAGSSRPPSVRKKTHHDIEVEEMLPIEEPTVQDNSRPLGGLLRVSEHLKSKGIQEEEEPYSPS